MKVSLSLSLSLSQNETLTLKMVFILFFFLVTHPEKLASSKKRGTAPHHGHPPSSFDGTLPAPFPWFGMGSEGGRKTTEPTRVMGAKAHGSGAGGVLFVNFFFGFWVSLSTQPTKKGCRFFSFQGHWASEKAVLVYSHEFEFRAINI